MNSELRYLFASHVVLSFFAIGLLTNCSSPPAKKKPPTSSYGPGSGLGADYSQCTSSSCPKANPQVYVNGVATPNLTAQINQPVNWSISGKDPLYSGRSFAVVRASFNPTVAGLNVQRNANTLYAGGSVTVTGQLTNAQISTSSSLSVVIRDLTACEVLSGTTGSATCSNASQTTQHDTTATAYLSVANNSYNPNGTVPGINNNTGDLGTNIAIMAGLGALRAILNPSGGGVGDVLNGALNGALSGLQSNPQTGGILNLLSNGGVYNPSNTNTSPTQPLNQLQGN